MGKGEGVKSWNPEKNYQIQCSLENKFLNSNPEKNKVQMLDPVMGDIKFLLQKMEDSRTPPPKTSLANPKFSSNLMNLSYC